MATQQAQPVSTEAAILSRLIGPDRADLSSEAARALLQLRLDHADLERLHELVTKNQDGALTPAKRSDLESYLRVSSFLDLMHAKARRSLRRPETASLTGSA
jgi:hypothetical protein